MRRPPSKTQTALAAAIGLLVVAAPARAELPPAQAQQLLASVTAAEPVISNLALSIWGYAETGFHEDKSTAALQAELKKAGFQVTAGVADMPTAFVASFKRGKGPVMGLLAEFDALPGLAQKAIPERAPIAGQAAGHACGHNLFGAASVGAAVAIAQWMIANNIQGEVRLYGTPAEEGGGGKVFMVRDGLMKDVDAVLTWHPNNQNTAAQSRNLAQISARFTFSGQSAHAASAPEQGRSALDAVESMDYMVNMMREHVPQTTRIHYIISDGGQAPNVVPNLAKSDYVVRHPVDRENQAIFARVIKAAEGAAMGTGTTVKYTVTSSFKDVLQNDTLGRVMDRNMRIVGGVKLNEEELAWARTLQKTLPDPASSDLADFERVRDYSLEGQIYASSDVGDVSYVTPTASIGTATFVPGTPFHSWQSAAAAGTTIGVKGAVVAAKILALSAAELMTDPITLAAAKAEMEKRRGADFKYVTLIETMKPPINYRDAR